MDDSRCDGATYLALAAAGGLALAWRGDRKELRRLAAAEQIRYSAALYARAVDRLDAELLKLPFAEDARAGVYASARGEGGPPRRRSFLDATPAQAAIDIPNLPAPVSRDVFARECVAFLGNKCVATQHCLCNPLVKVAPDGSSAVSEIHFVAHHWTRDASGDVRDAGGRAGGAPRRASRKA